MKIKEFKFVLSDYTDFEKKVNHWITKGYQPYGDIHDDHDEGGLPLIMCMVKYEEESKHEDKESGEVNVKYILDIDDYNKFKKEWESCKDPSKLVYTQKDRKVVDVIDCHSLPTINNIIQIRDDLTAKGWTLIEQGHREFYGFYLKMVKYEN